MHVQTESFKAPPDTSIQCSDPVSFAEDCIQHINLGMREPTNKEVHQKAEDSGQIHTES